MPNYRVSLAFASLPDADLDEFTGGVILSLTGNASFPTPLVPLIGLGLVQTAFHDAVLAAAGGGTLLTAIKNEKRTDLVRLLRQEASYVQAVAGQNLATLLSSGFAATSTNRARSPLDTPVILSLENGMSTQLLLRVGPVVNAKAYEVQIRNGAGWMPAGVFTQGRAITLPGLTPGQIYSAQARAVGGSTGYSDWSDPVSHMVM